MINRATLARACSSLYRHHARHRSYLFVYGRSSSSENSVLLARNCSSRRKMCEFASVGMQRANARIADTHTSARERRASAKLLLVVVTRRRCASACWRWRRKKKRSAPPRARWRARARACASALARSQARTLLAGASTARFFARLRTCGGASCQGVAKIKRCKTLRVALLRKTHLAARRIAAAHSPPPLPAASFARAPRALGPQARARTLIHTMLICQHALAHMRLFVVARRHNARQNA